MKNFDLNEILASSMKNMASNYKSEAPPWFMPGHSKMDDLSSTSLFNSLSAQMMQFAIFNGKTLHKFSIYLPDNQYNLSSLDGVINHIKNNHKTLKNVLREESSAVFLSSEEVLCFDYNSSKIEVSSLLGTELKSLQQTMKSIGI
jgi:hypothetical protein